MLQKPCPGAAFALFGYYTLVITQELIDGRCGVAHNHRLELFDLLIKAFPSSRSSAIMLGQQKERWKELCELAAQEQNPERLIELATEINRLFEEKEQRRICDTQATGRFKGSDPIAGQHSFGALVIAQR